MMADKLNLHWSESKNYIAEAGADSGVSKEGFLRGGEISIIGVVRTPVAIINFASNPCENL